MPRRRRARSIRTRLGARRQPHQAGEGAGGARARAHDRAALGIWRGRARSLRLTTHEVAFTLADTNAAIMDRVRDKVKHAETLAAVMAQGPFCRGIGGPGKRRTRR